MSTRHAIVPQRPHALYKEHGYSPAILSGDLLFVSGMVGAREDGTPEADLKQQVQLAFDNLRGVLTAADCTFDDVIDVTIFLVDPEASMSLMLDGMKKAFPREPFPNVTAVGVNWLAGFQFEIKVIARVPSPASPTPASNADRDAERGRLGPEPISHGHPRCSHSPGSPWARSGVSECASGIPSELL